MKNTIWQTCGQANADFKTELRFKRGQCYDIENILAEKF
jgi:hypothetical protein